jgi:hypothetical protein
VRITSDTCLRGAGYPNSGYGTEDRGQRLHEARRAERLLQGRVNRPHDHEWIAVFGPMSGLYVCRSCRGDANRCERDRDVRIVARRPPPEDGPTTTSHSARLARLQPILMKIEYRWNRQYGRGIGRSEGSSRPSPTRSRQTLLGRARRALSSSVQTRSRPPDEAGRADRERSVDWPRHALPVDRRARAWRQ